jgi:hypothetical protein
MTALDRLIIAANAAQLAGFNETAAALVALANGMKGNL